MFGNGTKYLGPSAAAGSAAGSTNNNQQHQSQFSRNLWPTATTIQGGECKLKFQIRWKMFEIFLAILR
jgi:hypothetical protein